ncbi:hypothetical protein JST99_01080 [Candidatus Dependentiae bacterium]|nr:hypothetical protein [Candidatus Dependentiae bacterium]
MKQKNDYKMAYVTIKFDEVLYVTKADIPGMYSIGHCLTDDIASGKERIAWILNGSCDSISNNRTFMVKDDNNIITDDLYADDSCDVSLSVPIPAMINLLEQLDEICKTNPEEVTIYYENEKFRIEAKERKQG